MNDGREILLPVIFFHPVFVKPKGFIYLSK